MLNKVTLIGYLGQDPEFRHMQDGKPVCHLSLATKESWKDKKTREKKEKTDWHRVTIFNEGLCNFAKDYLKQGAKIYLEGKLETRQWVDKNGNERETTEIILKGYNSTLKLM